jgi:sugar-specific transcriptional regulator TrmB/DNA-binding CsgD family transcriptional regulator
MLEGLGLSAKEEAVYLALLDHTFVRATELEAMGIDDPNDALASLQSRGLVAHVGGAVDAYQAADLRTAVQETARELEIALDSLQHVVSGLRKRIGSGEPATLPIDQVEYVASTESPRDRIYWWLSKAEKEICVLEPGPYAPRDKDRAKKAEEHTLSRGINNRVIYSHEAIEQRPADDLPFSISRGEQARVLPDVAAKLFVFDRATVALPARPGGRFSDGLLLVRHDMLVHVITAMFEAMWTKAIPLDSLLTLRHSSELTEDERQLLSLMASGLTDKAIGRQLEISERTVQRRVARIIERLDAETRFQAGLQAARRGLFDSTQPSLATDLMS